MLEIPLINFPNQELLITLDSQNCTISIYQRDDYTFLDLIVGQEAIVQGAICMPLTPIVQKPANFKGQLFIWDSTSPDNAQALARYQDLGTRFKLMYVSEDEIKNA